MVRHILLLAPRPETTAEQIAEACALVEALPGRIPGLVDAHWGTNFAAPERRENFTHGFSMDFDSRESLAAYAPHPAHVPVAAKVRAAFERIVVLDFDLS